MTADEKQYKQLDRDQHVNPHLNFHNYNNAVEV